MEKCAVSVVLWLTLMAVFGESRNYECAQHLAGPLPQQAAWYKRSLNRVGIDRCLQRTDSLPENCRYTDLEKCNIVCEGITQFPCPKSEDESWPMAADSLTLRHCDIPKFSTNENEDGYANFQAMLYALHSGSGYEINSLKTLAITNCNVVHIDDDVFMEIGDNLLSTLKVLDLSYNKLESFTIPSGAQWSPDASLKVDVSFNQIHTLEGGYFNVLKESERNFLSVEMMDFTGNPISQINNLWNETFLDILEPKYRHRHSLYINTQPACEKSRELACESCRWKWMNQSGGLFEGFCYDGQSACMALEDFVETDITKGTPDKLCLQPRPNHHIMIITITASAGGLLLLSITIIMVVIRIKVASTTSTNPHGEQPQLDPERRPLLGTGGGSGSGAGQSVSPSIQAGRLYGHSSDGSSSGDQAATLVVGSTGSVSQHMLAQFIIPFSEVELKGKIGYGGSGEVFRAMWHNTPVAVKRLFKHLQAEEEHVLRREAAIMSNLRHPNVVLFLGICIEPHNLCIIQEFYAQGSVCDILFKSGRRITWQERLSIALDASRGMEFLHSRKPAIIHCDLRCSNLMVDEHMKVKVGDFGLSRMVTVHPRPDDSSQMPGAIRWMAPELFKQPYVLTLKADIYSFGVVLWELVARNKPFTHLRFYSEVMDAVGSGQRPEIPTKETLPAYSELMQRCWHQDPEQRPFFPEIITALQEINLESQPPAE